MTNWGTTFNRALSRGEDHGAAAMLADKAEKRSMQGYDPDNLMDEIRILTARVAELEADLCIAARVANTYRAEVAAIKAKAAEEPVDWAERLGKDLLSILNFLEGYGFPEYQQMRDAHTTLTAYREAKP